MKVKNPLGHTSMKHHLYAVQALYYEQVQQGHRDKWSECYTTLCKEIMSICEKRVKKNKLLNDEEKDDNLLIAYNAVDGISNIFDFLYAEVESQTTYRKKYEILRSTAIMSATMFGAMRGETLLDANLSDMNMLKLNGWDPSTIDMLLIRMVAGMSILFIN